MVCTTEIVFNWDKKRNCPEGLEKSASMGYDAFMDLQNWIKSNPKKARQLAKHVGWPPSMLSKVKLGKKAVPDGKAPSIEEFTNGEVSCEEMCPHVKWHILRADGSLNQQTTETEAL